jgi:UDP-GlcNAc3NAcA epimerase
MEFFHADHRTKVFLDQLQAMLKLLNVVGARPQIIKAGAISREIRDHFRNTISEVILHTGQHYDAEMSQVFFDELSIPEPHYNLNVGSGSHAVQTSAMIAGAEEVIKRERPDCVVIYGDTNSTLAVSLTAAKEHYPVVHIEAGLRSFNKSMPEEINRILCDHMSTLLFTPTKRGLENLLREGFHPAGRPPYSPDHPGVFHCGDIMYDNSLHYSEIAAQKSDIVNMLNLREREFCLVTIHRNVNTDSPERLNTIFQTIFNLSEEFALSFVIPLHPRTQKMMHIMLDPSLLGRIQQSIHIQIIKPVSFFEMIELEKYCRLVLTDSGGVQKEAFFFRKPGIILREETEWTEIVDCGAARLVDANPVLITQAFRHYIMNEDISFPELFGDGRASGFICQTILEHVGS